MNKKSVLLCIAFILGVQLLYANNLDLKTRQLIQLLEPTGLQKQHAYASIIQSEPLLKYFPILLNAHSEYFTSALVKIVFSEFNENDVLRQGIQIQSRMGNIYSMLIPLRSLKYMAEINGIQWVELARNARLKLDLSRIEIKADKVHLGGEGLSRSYTGEGVIVGIIDTGIDFSHPDFQYPDGSTRLISIWDQVENSGSPPSGFSYGTEWTASQIDNGQCTHRDIEAHGTHVMGIGAGNGASRTDMHYKGIAPETKLICVAMGWQTTAIADAANYIFQKAGANPVVINMSLGTHEGPHDGSSSLDQAFDNISGPGKIFVGSAGNETGQYVHVGQTLTNDSLFTCFAAMNESMNDLENNLIDIWGEANADFNIAIIGIDASGEVKFRRESRKENISRETFTEAAVEVASYIIGYEKNSLNGHPHYNFIGFFYEPSNKYEWYIKFSGNGTFDAWTEYNPMWVNFKPEKPHAFPYAAGLYLPGDNEKNVGEIGGTARSVITVGAYTTKNEWNDYQNQPCKLDPFTKYGEIAPFSSSGPTRDGRLKPEISAPGNIVVSALSSQALAEELDPSRIISLPNNPALTNGYIGYEGTSMAAPHITGTIALMLQARPDLNSADIKLLLQRNARRDNFTGSEASYQWGYGKVDALEMVKAAEDFVGVSDLKTFSPDAIELFDNYPNPFNASTTITFTLSKPNYVSLKIYNCLGKEIAELVSRKMDARENKVTFDAGNFSSGIYFYKLIVGKHVNIKKMVLVK